jgi:hypothetical protein
MIPDNISTVEHAFALRNEAEKYLFTCYSYLPDLGVQDNNPAFLSGDEVWFFYPYTTAFYGAPSSVWEVARGNQTITGPYLNYWDGAYGTVISSWKIYIRSPIWMSRKRKDGSVK